MTIYRSTVYSDIVVSDNLLSDRSHCIYHCHPIGGNDLNCSNRSIALQSTAKFHQLKDRQRQRTLVMRFRWKILLERLLDNDFKFVGKFTKEKLTK
jgi:hypothetical protein